MIVFFYLFDAFDKKAIEAQLESENDFYCDVIEKYFIIDL